MCIENDFGVIWYLVFIISIYYKSIDVIKEVENVMNKEMERGKLWI